MMKKLLTKENLEVLIIDGLTAIGIYLIGEINLPIAVYTPIAILAIFYAMAKKEPPKNIMQLVFAVALCGVVASIAGLLFLLYDNSIVAALFGLIIGFVFAMSKVDSKGQISVTLNKLYDHKSRIFILPIVFNLFILGAESIFKYRISPGFAMVFMCGTYIPVRIMFLFKPEAKWYHFFIMAAAGYLYVSNMSDKIYNSPTTPVWIGIENELGDYLTEIETDSVDGVLIEVNLGKKRYGTKDIKKGKYYFVVNPDSTNRWNIDWEKSDTLNKHRGYWEFKDFKKLRGYVWRNLENY